MEKNKFGQPQGRYQFGTILITQYSIGVQIQQFDGAIGQGFVISPIGQNLQPSQVASSLSFVFGIIANELIELCIPHNVLFSDNGNHIYFLLREFASEKYLLGWLQFCGVIPVDNENDFQIKEEEIVARKKELRIQGKLVEALKRNITKNLESFI